jgi:hypothetical protein
MIGYVYRNCTLQLRAFSGLAYIHPIQKEKSCDLMDTVYGNKSVKKALSAVLF